MNLAVVMEGGASRSRHSFRCVYSN
jgi:hypothetical protein